MSVSLRPPDEDAVRRFLARAGAAALDYEGIGGTSEPGRAAPAGYDADESSMEVGRGAAAFGRARAAVWNWEMFPRGWCRVLPERPPVEGGATVMMLARVAGLWWANACRIVYVVDEPRRAGFAYGTLPEHVERGEELFLVERGADDAVRFTICARSRPRHPLARLFYPYARALQRRFVAQAMERVRAATQDGA